MKKWKLLEIWSQVVLMTLNHCTVYNQHIILRQLLTQTTIITIDPTTLVS